MKLRTILNKDIALSCYLKNIINLNSWPWIKGPLSNVPAELILRAEKYKSPVDFSYNVHPIKDLKAWEEGFEKLIGEIEALHNERWEKYQPEISAVFKQLQHFVRTFGHNVVDTIPTITKLRWPAGEVLLTPSIYSGATVFHHVIFIGINKFPLNTLISLCVHELIHVNTDGARDQLISSLTYPIDSNEIATVLLTNKVTNLINRKYNNRKMRIEQQQFHSYYEKRVKKHETQIYEIGRENDSYKQLILAIDKYLSTEKYKGFYNTYQAHE